MEMEFFCRPGTDDEWFQRWVETRQSWYTNLGLSAARLRLRAHDKLVALPGHHRHRVPVPVRLGRAEGIANRTDFDLRQHQRGMRTLGKLGRRRAVRRRAEEDGDGARRASCRTSTMKRRHATSPT